MSEGGEAISGKYWFHSIVPKRTFLAPCDMKTEGESKCLSIFLQTKNGSPLTNALTEMLWVDCDSPCPPPPKKKKMPPECIHHLSHTDRFEIRSNRIGNFPL